MFRVSCMFLMPTEAGQYSGLGLANRIDQRAKSPLALRPTPFPNQPGNALGQQINRQIATQWIGQPGGIADQQRSGGSDPKASAVSMMMFVG